MIIIVRILIANAEIWWKQPISMAHQVIKKIGLGYGVYSWTEGFKTTLPQLNLLDEKAVLAECLYLEKQGLKDEASLLLERHCLAVEMKVKLI